MSKDFLAEYDAAADEDKYPLVQKWMKTTPLPFFRQLRDQRPALLDHYSWLMGDPNPPSTVVQDLSTSLKMTKMDLFRGSLGILRG